MGKELNKILLVEDDPDIQVIVQMMLESQGMTVEICSSGVQALQKVSMIEPDLILMDMMMPGLNGLQTLAEMKSRSLLGDTPVVFMTAKVQPHELEMYKNEGATGIIVKPFDPLKLLDRLKEFSL